MDSVDQTDQQFIKEGQEAVDLAILEQQVADAAREAERKEKERLGQTDPYVRRQLLIEDLEGFSKRLLEASEKFQSVETVKAEIALLGMEIETGLAGIRAENATLAKDAYDKFLEESSRRFETTVREQKEELNTFILDVTKRFDAFIDFYTTELRKQAEHREKESAFLELATRVLGRYV